MTIKDKLQYLNDTSTFLLPVLGLKTEDLYKLGFINCYLSDKDREPINNDIHLYLLFKPNTEIIEITTLGGFIAREKDTQYDRLVKKIKELEELDDSNKILIEDYDYEDGFVVLVLKFPEYYRKDYNLFLQGKYTHFSKAFKNKFAEKKVVEFINEKGRKEKLLGFNFAYHVMHRTEQAKKFTESKYDIEIPEEQEEYWRIPATSVEGECGREVLNIERIKKELEKQS